MTALEIIQRGAPYRLVRKQEFPMQWVMRSRIGEDVATFEDETWGETAVMSLNEIAKLTRLIHRGDAETQSNVSKNERTK